MSRSVVACFCRCYYSFPFSCSQMSVLLCIYGWRARCVHFSHQKQILPYCVCGIIISNFFRCCCCCCMCGYVCSFAVSNSQEKRLCIPRQTTSSKKGSQIRWFKRKTRKCFAFNVQQKKKEFSSVQHFTSRSMHVCKRTTESLCFSIEHISFSLVLCSHALSVISFFFVIRSRLGVFFFCEQKKKMIKIKEKKNKFVWKIIIVVYSMCERAIEIVKFFDCL